MPAEIASLPVAPRFSHSVLSNGMVVATCLICLKTIASPKPLRLQMAEDAHFLEGCITRAINCGRMWGHLGHPQ